MRRYALRDDQWERIKDLLPGRDGHVGVTAKDNRLFVEAVLYRYRAGVPWRDLPERFGDWKAVHTRHTRWAESGVWEKLFKALAADADNEYAMIDSTIVRAHQHSPRARKKKPHPLMEIFFCRHKHSRATATRSEKRAINSLAGVYVAATLFLLN